MHWSLECVGIHPEGLAHVRFREVASLVGLIYYVLNETLMKPPSSDPFASLSSRSDLTGSGDQILSSFL